MKSQGHLKEKVESLATFSWIRGALRTRCHFGSYQGAVASSLMRFTSTHRNCQDGPAAEKFKVKCVSAPRNLLCLWKEKCWKVIPQPRETQVAEVHFQHHVVVMSGLLHRKSNLHSHCCLSQILSALIRCRQLTCNRSNPSLLIHWRPANHEYLKV